jgi:predicted metalloendopeptidase
MEEMIRNIQDAVYETIDTVDWIDTDETREKAKVKANKMKEFVGFPNWLINNSSALDVYYKGVRLHYFIVFSCMHKCILCYLCS